MTRILVTSVVTMDTSSPSGQSNMTDVLFQDSNQSSGILMTLNKMRKENQLTDTTVFVGSQSFPCHRVILACCSEYFRAMFSSKLRESGEGQVFLDKMDPVILGSLIEYAYTSVIRINTTNAQALLEAAQRLQFVKIVEACCDFIQNNLDPSNCLGVMMFADRHSCSRLYQTTLKYSLQRFEEVCKHDEFQHLPINQLVEYLSCDELNVRSEEVVYRSILLWMEYKKNINSSDLFRLLRCVRLHYLCPDFLHSLLDKPKIAPSLEIRTLIHQAIDIQQKPQSRMLLVSCAKPRLATMTEVMVIVGGYCDDHSCITEIQFLNPIIKKWETLTTMPEALQGFSVTSLRNCIYIIGGKQRSSFSSSVYRYDTEIDKWYIMTGMNFARQHHRCAVIGDLIFVAGGENRTGYVGEVEAFSPLSNKWETITVLPQAVSGPAVASYNQKLFVVGGQASHALTYGHIQCFDTVVSEWTIIETVPIKSRHFPVLMLNGFLYILGGCGRNGIQVYDPDTDSCLPPMRMCHNERHLFAAVTLQQQGVIVVAGGMRNYHALTTAEAFSPDAGYWSKVVDMPRALRGHGCGVTIHKYLGPPHYKNNSHDLPTKTG